MEFNEKYKDLSNKEKVIRILFEAKDRLITIPERAFMNAYIEELEGIVRDGKAVRTSEKDLRVCEVSNSLPSDVKEIISFLQWMFKKVDKGDQPIESMRMLTMLRDKIESVKFDGNGC